MVLMVIQALGLALVVVLEETAAAMAQETPLARWEKRLKKRRKRAAKRKQAALQRLAAVVEVCMLGVVPR